MLALPFLLFSAFPAQAQQDGNTASLPKPRIVEPYDDLGDGSVILHGKGQVDMILDDGVVIDDRMFHFASSYEVRTLNGVGLRITNIEPGQGSGYTLNNEGELLRIYPMPTE
jgi:hypothetical protein